MLIDLLRRRLGAHGTTVLEIDLSRGVVSAPPESPFEVLRTLHAASMRALRDGLRAAADDNHVAGLVVHVGDCQLNLTQAQELADRIVEFGKHKPTIAWSESFGEGTNALSAYTLATACTDVWVQPTGELNINGVHVGITLVRGLLEKGGIEPQFEQRYEYKSAAEQLSGTEISDANQEMMQRIADSIVDHCVASIAERRGLTADEVRAAVDASPITPEDALTRKLVTGVGYRDEVYAHLYEQWQAKRENLLFVHRYAGKVMAKRALREAANRSAPAIGVVQLRGPIITGRGRPGGGPGGPQAASDVVNEHLRAAMHDDKIKAVIVRIDSPGGSAVASDAIWRTIHQVRESGRPVVTQMNALAASGGYYTGMAADEIVALPGTLTGSIGVLAGKLVTLGLFDKLGLKHQGLSAGRRAGAMASDQPFSDEDWQVLNAWLDRVYEQFTTKAAADRGMAVSELEPLARGRVWTGADAHERKLVDHLGGMETAIDRACVLADLDRDHVVLKAVPAMGALERLLPADSSESQGASGAVDMAVGPEALLQRALALAGLDAARVTGPLALPFRLSIR